MPVTVWVELIMSHATSKSTMNEVNMPELVISITTLVTHHSAFLSPDKLKLATILFELRLFTGSEPHSRYAMAV